MSKARAPSIDNEHDGMRYVRGLTLLADERYTPAECVHKFGKPTWVLAALELQGIPCFPVALDHRCLVFTGIVIRRRENGYEAGFAPTLAVCAIPIHNSNQKELR